MYFWINPGSHLQAFKLAGTQFETNSLEAISCLNEGNKVFGDICESNVT